VEHITIEVYVPGGTSGGVSPKCFRCGGKGGWHGIQNKVRELNEYLSDFNSKVDQINERVSQINQILKKRILARC
jgi:hypothetical protein